LLADLEVEGELPMRRLLYILEILKLSTFSQKVENKIELKTFYL
jgi:hypothetical protein